MAEATDFLYPFIEGDETDADALLADLSRSAQGKWAQSTDLRARTLEENAAEIAEVARLMADRFAAGGRLFAFGNGGSATDAEGVAQLYTRPPRDLGPGLGSGRDRSGRDRSGRDRSGRDRSVRPLSARSLAEDQAVITALSNDVGFDKVFSRQLIAHGRPVDIAVGYSTSGNSDNLLVAFAEAAKQGMLTVGLAGSSGGRMATDRSVAHCFVVPSDSVHRIQEAQAALTHALWWAVQGQLDARAA